MIDGSISDIGLLQALKCHYKSDFLQKMLGYVNNRKSVLEFVKSVTIKYAV